MPKKERRRKGQGSIYKRGDSPYWWMKGPGIKPKSTGIRIDAKGSEDQALRELHKNLEDVENGKVPEATGLQVKFEKLKDLILEHYETEGNRSKDSLEFHLQILGEYFKGKSVKWIAAKIKDYKDWRKKRGVVAERNGVVERIKDVSDTTINRELAALREMFNLAADQNPSLISRDMVPTIKLTSEATKIKKRFFEKEDFIRFRDTAPSWLGRLVTFGYFTGWRVSELTSRTWDHYENGFLILESEDSKNKSPRLFPVASVPELVEILEEIKDEWGSEGYIFRNAKGNPIGDIRKAWNQTSRNLGLGYGYSQGRAYKEKWEKEGLQEGPTFHDFRRTAARNLIRAGVSKHTAKQLTGHKTDNVFDRYDIVEHKDLMIAANLLGAYHEGKAQVTLRVTNGALVPESFDSKGSEELG